MKPTVKIYAKDLEASAQAQVEQLAEIPGVSKSGIRIMPDGHAGSGCVVGTVLEIGDKVIPGVVGVDGSCGMTMAIFEWDTRDFDTRAFYDWINRYVPSGFSIHKRQLDPRAVALNSKITQGLRCFTALTHKKEAGNKFLNALGTLGGESLHRDLGIQKRIGGFDCAFRQSKFGVANGSALSRSCEHDMSSRCS